MTGASTQTLQQLHSVLARSLLEPDGDLLRRFVAERDESAFTELLQRHGPMVLSVSRRVLGSLHDAEDVFQATFLTLARNAASVRRPDFLGAWLHRIAFRLALRSRRACLRRRSLMVERVPQPPPDPLDDLSGRELLALLDKELLGLPDPYRLPLVLCCLEGLSQEEAARRLGWSPGSVKGRLERGRAQLRRRLARRGLTLPGTVAGPLLLGGTLAVVPAALARGTLDAVLHRAPVSPAVLALAGGLMRTLIWARLKRIGAFLFLIGTLGAGTGILALQRASAPPVAAQPLAAPSTLVEADHPLQQAAHVDAHGDALPDAAILRLGSLRFRHADGAGALVLSPDGKTVVTEGAGAIRVWDAATGKQRHLFRVQHRIDGFFAGQEPLAVSCDSRHLFTTGDDGKILAWDLTSGEGQTISLGDCGTVHSVSLSPDGGLLAAGTARGIVVRDQRAARTLYEIKSRKHNLALPPGSDRLLFNIPYSLAIFSPDGNTLAMHTSAAPEEVLLCDPKSGRERQRIGLGARLVRLAFAPDSKHLALTERDNAVRIYETATGRRVQAWTVKLSDPYENYTSVLAFAPDGKSLAAGATDNIIRLWDVTTGREVRTFRGHGWYVIGLAFAPGGAVLYSASWDGTVRRWQVDSGRELPVADGYSVSVVIAFSPDGGRLASSGGGAEVHVWDASTGRRVRVLQGDPAGTASLAFSPDGHLLAAGGDGLTVRLWDAATGQPVRQWRWPRKQPYASAERLTFSPDGRTLATTVFRTSEILLWDVHSGQRRSSWHHEMVRSAVFSPDGATLASGGWDKALRLWECSSGRLKGTFSLPAETDFNAKTYRDPRIECVAYSPDGRLLATWHLDGSVCLWNAESGRVLNKFKGDQGQGRSLAFSPDGLWLACVGENHAARIVEPRSGQVVLRLQGHLGWVSDMAFGPKGRSLLSGSRDNTALLWSLRPPQPSSAWNGETLWGDLGGGDAMAAYCAIWRLAEKPDEALAMLRQRLKPIQAVPEDILRSLVADLDADSFKRREEATRRLRDTSEAAAPVLRAALRGKPTAEQRRRVEGLLAELDAGHLSNEVLRQLRAIAVLEQIGPAKSGEVLQELAAGASSAALTRQAKAALARAK